MLTLKNNQVYEDGIHLGSKEDTIANYPILESEISVLVEENPQIEE